jgi:amidase
VDIDHGSLRYRVQAERPDERFSCRIFVNGLLIEQWDGTQPWEGSMSLAQLFDADMVAVVALFSGSGGGIGADVNASPRPKIAQPVNSLI